MVFGHEDCVMGRESTVGRGKGGKRLWEIKEVNVTNLQMVAGTGRKQRGVLFVFVFLYFMW